MRDAQAAAIEGRDGPDIRTALRDLRERSAELVRLAEAALAGAGRQPAAGEINARLSQVATNDVAVEQLRAGILGSGDTAPKDLFGGIEPAAPAPRKAAKPATPKKAAPAKEPAAKQDAAAERAEQQRRKEALVEANRRHAAAVKARHRAEAEVAKAETAVERARAALASAEETLAAAQAELASAVAAAGEAERDVDAARLAVQGTG